jgi:hypothetical protein
MQNNLDAQARKRHFARLLVCYGPVVFALPALFSSRKKKACGIREKGSILFQ